MVSVAEPEGQRTGQVAMQVASPETHRSHDTIQNGPSTSIPGFDLAVQQASQLPSPSPSRSPSPSSRNISPSQGGTESSVGNTGTLPSVAHERKYSGSFGKASTTSSATKDSDETAILSPLSISKTLPPHELHDIPEERIGKPREGSIIRANGEMPRPVGTESLAEENRRRPRKLSVNKVNGEILKLSAAEVEELISAPEYLPVTSPTRLTVSAQASLAPSPVIDIRGSVSDGPHSDVEGRRRRYRKTSAPEAMDVLPEDQVNRRARAETASHTFIRRPGHFSRAITTPPTASQHAPHTKAQQGQQSPKRKPNSSSLRPEPLDLSQVSAKLQNSASKPDSATPSPIPQSIPIPPMSIPTYLQLELSSTRPSPLYIYRPASSEFPYESSKVKFERLLNFLLLPPQLEQTLYFGTMACLDAWLHTFTILPLRFFKAAGILIQWWGQAIAKEARSIAGFIYQGSGRFWHRQRERRGSTDSAERSRSVSRASRPSASTMASYQSQSGRKIEIGPPNLNAEHLRVELERKSRQNWGRRHRRMKSQPSSLSSYNKADLLQGAVIMCSCIILMKLDASRMYHSIRGQSAIKLYVIFNALEVCDKLLAALGQDILECLFSNETLERDVDGRSKVLRPLCMFILALIYNVTHATALFYQVIALNVAVNSYSNALLTLLISNQFVEIKSTVFKKIEKDNLFQLTCADIVERFQLWLMLVIIALRNIVEVGGLSIISGSDGDMVGERASTRSSSIFPSSFTIFPSWSGEVLTPFLLVIGSEMLVDWIKHSYISKFNNVKPAVYQRYLDVLAKDYYTNAFVNQNLIKRLGLPVIPLSCLFIRSSMQTYHMFLATHLPSPVASTATALSVESTSTSAATTAALEHFDTIIRKALGRSTFGIPDPLATNPWYLPSADDAIAALTMLVFFLGAFFVLLACKLVLGMLLLQFARNRYRSMKKREHQNYGAEGKRLGVGGMTEVDEDKRRWIYQDDPEALRKMKEKEKMGKEKADKSLDFGKISRYEMLKRIW
ncbi:eukaryotic membrane protein family [Drepanopeziza brunnea f. sp. 'multigermtubi' MB_m1]|uniref:Eukaryotic membrane protein family n=1 Tax=Marssonina brunnea f. sp. multigermtubi (strain MB_m1) TaxID=1072389 RepID=K1WML6_MARBU|nr:eukaryotic membrane protein family [Drepanopeziza brunnea f. sp. 'multigermtubi' MB_m1]EKD18950.1 eukaryotic membrane protein family [Drepanopeziza brunnea f. sp. 'multigermtubi' MB_m1]